MKKILFIEDDTLLFDVYKDMLDPREISAVHASTGKEGLSKVSEDKPDLIVLDIMLPGGINGFDVLEQLKASSSYKNIPVIVLTNLDSEEKVAKKIGAWDYRVKANTTLEEIKELIMKCLSSS